MYSRLVLLMCATGTTLAIRKRCPTLSACDSFFFPYEAKFSSFAGNPGRAVSAQEQVELLTDLCVSYHAYYGCLYTWTREPDCWSKQPSMVLMNATFTVLCHPSVFPRVDKAKDCVPESIHRCRRPEIVYDTCASVLSVKQHIDCLYENVRSLPFNVPFNAHCSISQKEVLMLLDEIQLGFYGQALDLRCANFPEPKLDTMIELFNPDKLQANTVLDEIGSITVPLRNSNVADADRNKIVLSPLYPKCGAINRIEGTKCLLEFSTTSDESSSKFTSSDVNLSHLLMSPHGEETLMNTCLKLDAYQACLEHIWKREGRCSFGISLVATPRFVLSPICSDKDSFGVIRRHINCIRQWIGIDSVTSCMKPLMSLDTRSQRLFTEKGSANDLCAIAYAVRSSFHCLAELACPTSSVLETDAVIRAGASIQIGATETAMEEGCPIEINDSTLFV